MQLNQEPEWIDAQVFVACIFQFKITIIKNGNRGVNVHYYTNNKDAKSDEKEFNDTLKGHEMKFKTDVGVFSKKNIDFGSRLLIETFTPPSLLGNILDVGCGYGPIGLSLAKAYPDREIHLIDVNLRALALAEKNAQLNRLANVSIYESFSYEGVNGEFAAILSNPPIRAGKKIVHEIMTKAVDFLPLNGELWVVIQKKQGSPSAKEKMLAVFGNCEVMAKRKGYFILKSKKL